MYDFDISRLRNYIKGRKISVPMISEGTGISRSTLYNYVNDETPITVEALIKIFNFLNHSISEVIKNNNSEKLNVPSFITQKKGDKKSDFFEDPPNVPKSGLMESYEMNPFQLRTDVLMEHQKIPIYSMEAAAGIVTIFADLNSRNVVDYLDVPKAPKCDGAIYASGDSMYELIKSGDLLGYKYIADLPGDIYWGHIYILAIDMAGEEMVTVKFVQRGKDDDHIKLVSQNKHHQDKEVHISKVRSMGLVKLTLRYNTMS